MSYSDRFRPRDERKPRVSVAEAIDALTQHTKSSRAQHLLKSLRSELDGADAGQRDKTDDEPTPGQRAAASAAPNLDGREPATTSARD